MNTDVYFIAPDGGGSSIIVIYEFFYGGVAIDYNVAFLVPTTGQTFEDLRQIAITNMQAYATLKGYTVTSVSRYYPDLVTTSVEGLMSPADKTKLDSLTVSTRTTSASTLSLTTGTGATGTQISSTKVSTVRYTVSTSTTATIGAAATSVVVLEMASTNSATPGDWIEIGRFESDQTVTLALALQSVQIVKGQICADVPAGYYVKLRNSGTGTHSEAFVAGQKTIYG